MTVADFLQFDYDLRVISNPFEDQLRSARRRLHTMAVDVATAVGQFWKGYLSSPPGC
jgi:hypothetical protein